MTISIEESDINKVKENQEVTIKYQQTISL